MSTKIQGRGKGGVPDRGKGGVPGRGKGGVPSQGRGQGKGGVPSQGKGKNKPILKPIIFDKNNPNTDFKTLLVDDIKNNILSLYIFNDNVEQHKTIIAGGGNATIRPFNKYGKSKPTRSAGISTGENGVGFTTLKDSKNKIIHSGGITGSRNPMFHENISRIIRWYKGRCSFEIRKFYSEF